MRIMIFIWQGGSRIRVLERAMILITDYECRGRDLEEKGWVVVGFYIRKNGLDVDRNWELRKV